MQKRKRDPVVPEMRQRLTANRDGRITASQWLNLFSQPVAALLILLMMVLPAFGGELFTFAADFWWVGIPLVVLLVILPLGFRAYRYARAPVQFARLRTGAQPWRKLGFWRPQVFFTANEQPVTFPHRLAPHLPLQKETEYLVYFPDDRQGRVLLSIAPADHEDADHWLPTALFAARCQRRTRHNEF